MTPIATIRSCYQEKFGIPRQSGLVPTACATLVFEPEFRNADSVRGLEEFSHIWLIWQFHANSAKGWRPTVRPPRLGGNARTGVFATRSPYRPNPLGLSAVKLERIEHSREYGPLLHLSGIDLMDGTPVLDIKPYLPYADCINDATGGFASDPPEQRLDIRWPQAHHLTEEEKEVIGHTLALDPRPSYHDDTGRVYGVGISGRNIRFTIDGTVLTILSIERDES